MAVKKAPTCSENDAPTHYRVSQRSNGETSQSLSLKTERWGTITVSDFAVDIFFDEKTQAKLPAGRELAEIQSNAYNQCLPFFGNMRQRILKRYLDILSEADGRNSPWSVAVHFPNDNPSSTGEPIGFTTITLVRQKPFPEDLQKLDPSVRRIEIKFMKGTRGDNTFIVIVDDSALPKQPPPIVEHEDHKPSETHALSLIANPEQDSFAYEVFKHFKNEALRLSGNPQVETTESPPVTVFVLPEADEMSGEEKPVQEAAPEPEKPKAGKTRKPGRKKKSPKTRK